MTGQSKDEQNTVKPPKNSAKPIERDKFLAKRIESQAQANPSVQKFFQSIKSQKKAKLSQDTVYDRYISSRATSALLKSPFLYISPHKFLLKRPERTRKKAKSKNPAHIHIKQKEKKENEKNFCKKINSPSRKAKIPHKFRVKIKIQPRKQVKIEKYFQEKTKKKNKIGERYFVKENFKKVEIQKIGRAGKCSKKIVPSAENEKVLRENSQKNPKFANKRKAISRTEKSSDQKLPEELFEKSFEGSSEENISASPKREKCSSEDNETGEITSDHCNISTINASFSGRRETTPDSSPFTRSPSPPAKCSKAAPKFEPAPKRQLSFRTPRKAQPRCDTLSRNSPAAIRLRRALFPPSFTTQRKIEETPYRTLDAPGLCDNFYCSLLDWSQSGQLSVALQQSVYLYSVDSHSTRALFELPEDAPAVTSIAWGSSGPQLAVGFESGRIELWDVETRKLVQSSAVHKGRVGRLEWKGQLLASGGKDRKVIVQDPMRQKKIVAELAQHKQEVCGLKWAPNKDGMLATGGNDNKLLVWDMSSRQVVKQYSEHCAAVKAIDWSPHKSGLVASGGGSSDNIIRFWDVNQAGSASLQRVDCKSQVCNLLWSRNSDEILSTHGYTTNFIRIFEYGDPVTNIATFSGHKGRILHLALSPDGTSVVTGSGDETLKFWNVFPAAKKPIMEVPFSKRRLKFPALR